MIARMKIGRAESKTRAGSPRRFLVAVTPLRALGFTGTPVAKRMNRWQRQGPLGGWETMDVIFVLLGAVSLAAWVHLIGFHGAFWRADQRLEPSLPPPPLMT